MAWIKRQIENTVPDIVKSRTGMSLEDLQNDTRKYVYPGIKEAADLLIKHLDKNSCIRVYGDYDCDGITSLFILKTLFSAINYENVEFIAPRRFSDGYGINVARVKEFYEAGCDLLITIDNGIAALDAITLAKKLGMEVLILDHHEPFVDESGKIVLPTADVIVDPHITGGYVENDPTHKFEDLCGAGIGYYFAREVLALRGRKCRHDEVERIAAEITIAAGIGTVADLVELVDDNRRIVKDALKLMSQGFGTAGLRALMNELQIERATSTDIAFGIAPCLNASGRLYNDGADMMVELLSNRTEDEELLHMASEARKANDERKEMTRDAELRAEDMMLERGDESVIVLLDENLSPGIAGLVSSKLTETYYRPSIVLTKNAMGICKGSGRSIPEIDLKSLLDKTQEYLLGYGGHPAAAGLSLRAENLDAFREAICKAAPIIQAPTDQYYDIESAPDKDNLTTILNDIERFEPYGQGNEPLKVMVSGIKLGDSMGNTHKFIGSEKTHVKFITKYGFDIVWFNGAGEYKLMGLPKEIDIIGTLSWNSFKGKTTLRVLAEKVRRSQ